MIEGISQLSKYLIECVNASLDGRIAPPPPDGLDTEAFFAACEKHSLTPLVWASLYAAGLEPEASARFAAAQRRELMRSAMQDAAFGRIAAKLEERGVLYMPLKGFYTRFLYPEPSMRVMSDIDILIRPGDSSAAKEIMESLGFACIRYMTGDDDKYKKPGLLIEFHRGLDTDGLKDPSHYADPWKLSEPVSGMCRRMTPTEAYLYTAAHAKKHFMHHGAGLRTLIDIYLSMKKEPIDRELAHALAREMGMDRFLCTAERLALAAFEDAELTDGEEEVFRFMLESGVLGSDEHYEAAKLLRAGGEGRVNKAKYFLRLIFPPYEAMAKRDPVLKKAPYLLPFMHVRRWAQLVFSRRDRVERGLDRFEHTDVEDANRLKSIYRTAGIDE